MALFFFLLVNCIFIWVYVYVCMCLCSWMCVHISAESVEESQIAQSVNNCTWPLSRKGYLPIQWCELWIWKQQRKNCRSSATNYNKLPEKSWTENRQNVLSDGHLDIKNPDYSKSNSLVFVHEGYKFCFSVDIKGASTSRPWENSWTFISSFHTIILYLFIA